jgi:hypothetical protein
MVTFAERHLVNKWMFGWLDVHLFVICSPNVFPQKKPMRLNNDNFSKPKMNLFYFFWAQRPSSSSSSYNGAPPGHFKPEPRRQPPQAGLSFSFLCLDFLNIFLRNGYKML